MMRKNISRVGIILVIISCIMCSSYRKNQHRGKTNNHKKNLNRQQTTLSYVAVKKDSETIETAETQLVVASPAIVEEELQEKLSQTNDNEPQSYKTKWDLRGNDFSCNEDLMSGDLFMVEKVSDLSQNSSVFALMKTNSLSAKQSIQLNKVNLKLNSLKLSLADSDNQIKEIISLDAIYPKKEQYNSIMDSKTEDQKRTKIEQLKIKLLNGTNQINTPDAKMLSFYCFSLINERVQTADRLAQYQKMASSDVLKSDGLNDMLSYLYKNDEDHDNLNKNVHNHEYFSALTLCHNDIAYINKWILYINREKLDCNIEFNSQNVNGDDMYGESSDVVMNSGSSNNHQEQLAMKAQERLEEQNRLKAQKEQELKKSHLSQEEQDAAELEKLTNELSDLNTSMDQEQQYSQKEITGLMSNIQSMQQGISDKGQQLQCLEQALQIRQEEENTQVISLLKDEEISKVKSVVSTAKKQMKEAYQKRINDLKLSLNKQKDSIEQEKGGYDQLMINLIKGGLKKGDKSKCTADKSQILHGKTVDSVKLNDWIENACSFVLDTNENGVDLQDGVLDNINKCTKKELFCSSCCSNQFGIEELMLRTDCVQDCQDVMDLALQGKTTFTVDITNVVQPDAQDSMTSKVVSELAAKKAAISINKKKRKF